MTLRTKRGPLNALYALRHILEAGVPGQVSTLNAAEYCTAPASLDGPYTFAAESALEMTLADGVEKTMTIPADTYTAAEMVTLFNAAAPGGMVGELYCGEGFAIRAPSAGATYITIGDGSANTVLGYRDNEVFNRYPARAPTAYYVQHEGYDPDTMLPYVALRLSDSDYESDMHMATHSIVVRVAEAYAGPQHEGLSGGMYDQLMSLVECIGNVLRDIDNASLGGQVNDVFLRSLNAPLDAVQTPDRGLVWAYADLTVDVKVQEPV